MENMEILEMLDRFEQELRRDAAVCAALDSKEADDFLIMSEDFEDILDFNFSPFTPEEEAIIAYNEHCSEMRLMTEGSIF